MRQCVNHLLTSRLGIESPNPSYKGRKPKNGDVLEVSTVRTYGRVWKAFFNWCYEEELIDDNPVSRLRSPSQPERVPPVFTVEHIDRMLAGCDTSTPVGFRNYVIVLLLLDTGMRLAELCGLNIDDVHENYVKVYGKGRKEREIGIRPEVSKLLWKYVHKHRFPVADKRALFVGREGRLVPGTIQSILYRLKLSTAITDVRLSPHTFRHTYSNMYIEHGGDIFKLSRELGHSDVKTTELYLRSFSSTQARKDHNTYSPLSRIDLKHRRKRK